MDFATENLVGPYVIEFLLFFGTPGGIADVAYLERLKSFTQWLKTQDEVVPVTGLTDIIERFNSPAQIRFTNGDHLYRVTILIHPPSKG